VTGTDATLLEMLRGLPDPLAAVLALVAATLAALVLHRIAMVVLGRIDRHSDWIAEGTFERHAYRPLQWVVVSALARSVCEAFPVLAPVAPGVTVLLILGIGWLAARLALVLEDSFFARLDLSEADNLRARRLYTQVRVLRRIVVFLVAALTLGAILMSFDPLRRLGAGLLTSAGIAGIVIGFAAQRTMGNLIAGFQIAFTQPIRTDDVVIVEGEWGRIEEITLTYVVVRIWDERRLVVPISYFIEKPFQNWTRVTADLLGTVFLHLDYRVPVDDLRAELKRIVEGSSHWDGRVWRIHVTEAGERTLEVRALVSAADSGAAWELRCEVREGLVRYLQEHHPEALPRVRAEIGPLAPPPG
jgi:small-conductance mechanosensitive channel